MHGWCYSLDNGLVTDLRYQHRSSRPDWRKTYREALAKLWAGAEAERQSVGRYSVLSSSITTKLRFGPPREAFEQDVPEQAPGTRPFPTFAP